MARSDEDLRKNIVPCILFLAAGCFLVRLLLLYKFGIVVESDTLGYRELASAIRSGNLSADLGVRTPVFPLLLVLSGSNDSVTVWAQIVLSVTSILLFFDAIRLVTGKTTVAFMVAGLYGLWPMYARWDVTILSESLATSLTIACFWACVRYKGTDRLSWLLCACGLASFAALTRPNLVPLCLVIPVWAFAMSKNSVRMRYQAFGLALLPALILIGGWCTLNRIRFGWFTISTVSGLGMTDVTGDILSELPSGKDKALDIYVSSSVGFKRQTGSRNQAIWAVLPEMSHASGKSAVEISHDLIYYEVVAARNHPTEYVEAVAESYRRFWTDRPFTWLNSDFVKKGAFDVGNSSSGRALRASWIGRVLPITVGSMRLVFLAFLMLTPAILVQTNKFDKRLPRLWLWGIGLCGLVFALQCPEVADWVACAVFLGLAPIGLLFSFRDTSKSLLWLIVALTWSISLVTSVADYAKARYNVPIAPIACVGLAMCSRPRDESLHL